MTYQRLTFGQVLAKLRRQHFVVLSTSDADGRSYSAGVTYGLSGSDGDIRFFVMTRRHLRKARNIAQNPAVSLVVPLTRRLLWFLPPPTIQVHGHAEILDWRDATGVDTFRRFWLGRRILKAYETSHRRGEQRICFLVITPDPVITTYMVGSNVLRLVNRMESGAATVVIPRETS